MKATASAPRLTLRETVQHLILDEVIDKSAPQSTWKIMIMDESTTRAVSSALSMFDIMEHSVSLVENLKSGRQPFKDMDAVYFISPTIEAAHKVMGDFVTPERAKEIRRDDGTPGVAVARYGKVHLVFNGYVDKDIMDLFQTNPLLLNRIKTFKEIHFDFLSPESWIYHLDLPQSITHLFNRPADPAYPILIGKKLATLCITLNEYPNIRYQASSSIAKTIATTINQIVSEYKRNNSKFIPYGEDTSTNRERGVLIILDRVFDPLTPLMHEYTYQAMANDLLEIDENGLLHYETTTERGDKVNKEAILNSEVDELWLEHRHKHIAKVISSLKERMDDILQTNAGAKLAKKKGTEMDMTSMASAVKNLPQYQQTMNDLGRHVAIASKCMKEFSQQNLIEISAIEQTLSTGIDEDGKEVRGRKMVELVSQFLSNNPSMSKDLKIRLLLIYFITQRPVGAEDRRQVIGAARLTNVDQQVLYNMTLFLDSYSYDNDHNTNFSTNNPVATTMTTNTKTGFFSSIFGRGIREAEKIASTVEGDYTDTRHVSILKQILEQTINSQLPVERFASLGPNLPNNLDAKSMAQSARKFKGTDRWGGGGGSGGGGTKMTTHLVGGRIMTFIAGGLSYAEMRDGYDVMHKEGREILIGGSHITTPNQYIRDILDLQISR